MALQFEQFGTRQSGILYDELTLHSVENILSGPIEYGQNLGQFANDFCELSNFSEIFCVYNKPTIAVDLPNPKKLQRFKSEHFSGLALKHALNKISIGSIDDIQIDNVFDRWTDSCLGANFRVSDKTILRDGNDSPYSLLKGSLYEELLGITYFPSIQNLNQYIKISPLKADYLTYNLLVEAYSKLRALNLKEQQLIQSLSGIHSFNVPAIVKLIISKIDNRSQFSDELLYWQEQFAGFRSRVEELKMFSVKGEPADKILANCLKIKKDINQLLAKFSDLDTLTEVSKVGGADSIEIGYELTAENPLKLNLNVASLIKFGIAEVQKYLSLRRVQPLPKMFSDLRNFRGFNAKFKSIWNVDLEELGKAPLAEKNPINDLYSFNQQLVSSNISSRYYFSSHSSFREKESDLPMIEVLDLDMLIRQFALEFPIREYVYKKKGDPSYTRNDYHLDIASGFFRANRFNNALRHFFNVLDADPKTHEALHGISQCYYNLGLFDKAIYFIEQALVQRPDDPLILNNYANSLIKNKTYQDAETALKKCIEIDLLNKEARLNLISLYYTTDRANLGITKCKQALNNLGTIELHEVYFQLSIGYAMKKQWAEAVNYSKMALDINPIDAGYVDQQIRMLSHNSDTYGIGSQVEFTIKKASELLEIENYNAAYHLHALLFSYNVIPSQSLFKVAIYLDDKEETDYAIYYYKLLLSRDKTNSAAMVNLAIDLLMKGEFSDAIKYADMGFRLNPSDYMALNCLAGVFLTVGLWNSAENALKGILELEQSGIEIHPQILSSTLKHLQALETGNPEVKFGGVFTDALGS